MNLSEVSPRPSKPSLRVPLLVWAVFVAGLSLQLFSPHLEVAHDSFVIPQKLMSQQHPVDPQALVRREKMIQMSSALLTLTGAVGLALYYRRALRTHLLGKTD